MFRRRSCRDAGATSLELTLLTPVLALLTVTGVQLALWMHARHVALAAAQAGARAGAAYGSPPGAAEDAARRYADALGRRLLTDVHVTVTGSVTTVRIDVHADAVRLVPLLPLRVHETADKQLERLP